MEPGITKGSQLTRLRGKAAKLVDVRVRVTPRDQGGLLPGLNRVLRTGYRAKCVPLSTCDTFSSTSRVYVEDTRFGRPIAVSDAKLELELRTTGIMTGRHRVALPAGILRRTASRPAAVANLQKKQARKLAKMERIMDNIKGKLGTPLIPIPKTHFVLVADASSSMAPHAAGAVKLFNEQLATLDAANRRGDALNTVTVFRFKDKDQIQERFYNVPPGTVTCFEDEKAYDATGYSTPLYDAVVDAARRAMADTDPARSFVVFVLTDGEENASRRYNAAALRAFIETQQATDRWTFVFMVPPGYAAKFCMASGVPAGNVREWGKLDAAEINEVRTSTLSYLDQRKSGVRSSKNWFTTNLERVDTSQLCDVSPCVRIWTTAKEEDVRTFVDRKSNGRFDHGERFFELMKREDGVQDYKKLLLLDKATGCVYMDGPRSSIRSMLGMPQIGPVNLDPGNHAGYVLFVQSTSTNRILPRGTRVAFWE